MPSFDKIERIFQCSNCKVRFWRNVTKDEIAEMTCPRSCPAKVADVTDALLAEIQKKRKEVAAREKEVVEREKK